MQLNNPIFINQTDADNRYVNTTGDTINGNLNLGQNIATVRVISGVSEPTNATSLYISGMNNAYNVFSTNFAGGAIKIQAGSGNFAGGYIFINAGDDADALYDGRIVVQGGIDINNSHNFPKSIFIYKTGVSSATNNVSITQNSVDIINNLNIAGNTRISGTLSLSGNQLVDYVPQFINENTNFIISGNDNGRVILANSASEITATIVSGNVTGFNTTIIQIGAGQIFVTGSGINASIPILSYNNQYKTAGAGATVSVLHTGNNRYIMYGNTTL